jgi:hypothetical protein
MLVAPTATAAQVAELLDAVVEESPPVLADVLSGLEPLSP